MRSGPVAEALDRGSHFLDLREEREKLERKEDNGVFVRIDRYIWPENRRQPHEAF
jgi:hypothetical protein